VREARKARNGVVKGWSFGAAEINNSNKIQARHVTFLELRMFINI